MILGLGADIYCCLMRAGGDLDIKKAIYDSPRTNPNLKVALGKKHLSPGEFS